MPAAQWEPNTEYPRIVEQNKPEYQYCQHFQKKNKQVIAYTLKCVVVPLDTAIALLAADLHREHKLASADAIVYATARHVGAELLTCDAHFESLPDVAYFPKSA